MRSLPTPTARRAGRARFGKERSLGLLSRAQHLPDGNWRARQILGARISLGQETWQKHIERRKQNETHTEYHKEVAIRKEIEQRKRDEEEAVVNLEKELETEHEQRKLGENALEDGDVGYVTSHILRW